MKQKILSLDVTFNLTVEEALHCACGLDELLTYYSRAEATLQDVRTLIDTVNRMRKDLISALSKQDAVFYDGSPAATITTTNQL